MRLHRELRAFRIYIRQTIYHDYEKPSGGLARIMAPMACQHCEDAPCIKACPCGALHKGSGGSVQIDYDTCSGHAACKDACPYGAIYIDPVANQAVKCHNSTHRVDEGLEPPCASTWGPEHRQRLGAEQRIADRTRRDLRPAGVQFDRRSYSQDHLSQRDLIPSVGWFAERLLCEPDAAAITSWHDPEVAAALRDVGITAPDPAAADARRRLLRTVPTPTGRIAADSVAVDGGRIRGRRRTRGARTRAARGVRVRRGNRTRRGARPPRLHSAALVRGIRQHTRCRKAHRARALELGATGARTRRPRRRIPCTGGLRTDRPRRCSGRRLTALRFFVARCDRDRRSPRDLLTCPTPHDTSQARPRARRATCRSRSPGDPVRPLTRYRLAFPAANTTSISMAPVPPRSKFTLTCAYRLPRSSSIAHSGS